MPRKGVDPYEAAGARMERARQAREEIGDPEPHLPPELRIGRVPRASTRTVLVALGVFLAIGVVAVVSSPGTEPDGDCRRHEVDVRPDTTAKGLPVAWFTTGPPGRYVLTVGVAELGVDAAGAPRVVRTDPGNEADATVEGEVFTMDECRGAGRFLLRQDRGEHTVRLYRLDRSGGSGAGGSGRPEQVAETRLASNGRTA